MSFWSRLSRHESLFSRVAGNSGADLPLAMQSGHLTPERYRSAVLTCMGCSNPEACEASVSAGTHGVPEFCRNGAMLKRLADLIPGRGL